MAPASSPGPNAPQNRTSGEARLIEDCNLSRLILRDGVKYSSKAGVFRYLGGSKGWSTTKCMNACREDSLCQAFNYDKGKKWCYLLISKNDDMEVADGPTWSSGYRQECPDWLKNPAPPPPAGCTSFRMVSYGGTWYTTPKAGKILDKTQLDKGGSLVTCMNLCKLNTECYAYNYQLGEKWCYLFSAMASELELRTKGTWACGFKLGCTKSSLGPVFPSSGGAKVKIEPAVIYKVQSGPGLMQISVTFTGTVGKKARLTCKGIGSTCDTGYVFAKTEPTLIEDDKPMTLVASGGFQSTKTMYACWVHTLRDSGTIATCSEPAYAFPGDGGGDSLIVIEEPDTEGKR